MDLLFRVHTKTPPNIDGLLDDKLGRMPFSLFPDNEMQLYGEPLGRVRSYALAVPKDKHLGDDDEYPDIDVAIAQSARRHPCDVSSRRLENALRSSRAAGYDVADQFAAYLRKRIARRMLRPDKDLYHWLQAYELNAMFLQHDRNFLRQTDGEPTFEVVISTGLPAAKAVVHHMKEFADWLIARYDGIVWDGYEWRADGVNLKLLRRRTYDAAYRDHALSFSKPF